MLAFKNVLHVKSDTLIIDCLTGPQSPRDESHGILGEHRAQLLDR